MFLNQSTHPGSFQTKNKSHAIYRQSSDTTICSLVQGIPYWFVIVTIICLVLVIFHHMDYSLFIYLTLIKYTEGLYGLLPFHFLWMQVECQGQIFLFFICKWEKYLLVSSLHVPIIAIDVRWPMSFIDTLWCTMQIYVCFHLFQHFAHKIQHNLH